MGRLAIWGFAFGYFACYVPYSALTKALSFGDSSTALGGFELLPATALASLLGMFVFISAMRWWRFASRRTLLGVSIPFPGRWTFLSGLCTAAIIPTTTLAYTFDGVSIVFMMLLMRGGVLVIAPVVDFVSKRRVRWFSWLALALSLSALLVAFFGGSESRLALTTVAAVDVVIYLASYFVRLRFMSRLAKSDDPEATKRYFVEEQMTATPMLVLALLAFALLGDGPGARELSEGFSAIWSHPRLGEVLVVGLLSQGTGVFGGLILLDRRENSFCVPVNRASSILAGVTASFALTRLSAAPAPGTVDLIGAGLVVVAILFLSLPSVLRARAPE